MAYQYPGIENTVKGMRIAIEGWNAHAMTSAAGGKKKMTAQPIVGIRRAFL